MNARCEWIDVAKGITIMLMVIGHSSIPVVASHFIWSFHMPLFFIVSGWCTNWEKDDFLQFLKKKSRSLLIPFAIYSAIVLIIEEGIGEGNAYSVFVNGWQGYPLWFIPVLFFALLLSKLVMAVKHRVIHILLWISLAILGAGLCYGNLNLPWTVCSVPYAGFLIIEGGKLKEFANFITKPRLWILIGGFALALIVSHFYQMDMAWNRITPVLILTLGAFAGSMMMFSLSSYIVKYTNHISKVLQAIGKETYIILAFSQLPIMICNKYITTNPIFKYMTLVIVLISLKYLKDWINRVAKTSIL